MHNLQIKKFNPSVLEKATLITNGSNFMDTYYLKNGDILKVLKKREALPYKLAYSYFDFIRSLYSKLRQSSQLDVEEVVLPKAMYMDGDRLMGYSVLYFDMISLDDFLKENHDIETINDIFYRLGDVVKKANSQGIIMPDLGNANNILIDPKTKEIKLIDYDGLQIKGANSFSISKLMSGSDNPIFKASKYFNSFSMLFSKEFDKATLLALYLYYTTKTNVTQFGRDDFETRGCMIKLKQESLDRYLSEIGLKDSPLEEDVNLLYMNADNHYLNTGIKRLVKDYKLDQEKHIFVKR